MTTVDTVTAATMDTVTTVDMVEVDLHIYGDRFD
jgi:hypothetical protein